MEIVCKMLMNSPNIPINILYLTLNSYKTPIFCFKNFYFPYILMCKKGWEAWKCFIDNSYVRGDCGHAQGEHCICSRARSKVGTLLLSTCSYI